MEPESLRFQNTITIIKNVWYSRLNGFTRRRTQQKKEWDILPIEMVGWLVHLFLVPFLSLQPRRAGFPASHTLFPFCSLAFAHVLFAWDPHYPSYRCHAKL